MLPIKPGNYLCVYGDTMIEVVAKTAEIAKIEAFKVFLRRFEKLPNYDPNDHATVAHVEKKLFADITVLTIPEQIGVLDCTHFVENAGEAVQIPTYSIRTAESQKDENKKEQIKALIKLSTSFDEANSVVEKYTNDKTYAKKIEFLQSIFECRIVFKEGESEEADYIALLTSILNN